TLNSPEDEVISRKEKLREWAGKVRSSTAEAYALTFSISYLEGLVTGGVESDLATELERHHKRINEHFRVECPVDVTELRDRPLQLDCRAYYPFLHVTMQVLLSALGRTLNPEINIRYTCDSMGIIGIARLTPEAEIDKDAPSWNLTRLFGAMYHASIN